MSLTRYGILRAVVLAGLAALVLYSHVFVAIDLVRVKVLQTPTPATAGQVRATTLGLTAATALRPPIALIARINSPSSGTSPFSVAVDGVPVCKRDLAGGGTRRIDCAVGDGWRQTAEHEETIQGPPTAWTLEYLELATHHGNTSGAHYLVVLPASSDRYARPAPGWAIATWLILTALILLLPAPPPLPTWIRLLYRVVAGIVLLELAASLFSQWISDYRIVFSAGTFARLLVLLFVPRLWIVGVALVRAVAARLRTGSTAQRRIALAAVVLMLGAVGLTAWELFLSGPWEQFQTRRREERARGRLLAELQPVPLTNCEFKRFGEPNDGGYLLCANLLASVESGYSYGISGYDQWGCDVSRDLAVPVHEYDCFNLDVPACAGGRTVFHGECIGEAPATIDGRPFDTLENQFAKNGDGVKRVVVKMDVEGAEWDSLQQTPDAVLQRIDQLTIEMHGVGDPYKFSAVVAKLKQFFYVANRHFNNFACREGIAPFPAEVYEVLFVSKRLGVPGGPGPAGADRSLMAPNIPEWKDCQSLADLPPVRQ